MHQTAREGTSILFADKRTGYPADAVHILLIAHNCWYISANRYTIASPESAVYPSRIRSGTPTIASRALSYSRNEYATRFIIQAPCVTYSITLFVVRSEPRRQTLGRSPLSPRLWYPSENNAASICRHSAAAIIVLFPNKRDSIAALPRSHLPPLYIYAEVKSIPAEAADSVSKSYHPRTLRLACHFFSPLPFLPFTHIFDNFFPLVRMSQLHKSNIYLPVVSTSHLSASRSPPQRWTRAYEHAYLWA